MSQTLQAAGDKLQDLLVAHKTLDEPLAELELQEPKDTRSVDIEVSATAPNPQDSKEIGSEEIQSQEKVRPTCVESVIEDRDAESSEEGDAELPDDWEKHWDDTYEMHYYWNAVSGESSWERPRQSWSV